MLVDPYVAGEMTDFSSEELRVNTIIDHNSFYGIVFGGGRLSETQFQICLEDYVLTNQAAIFETVKHKTQPLSVRYVYLVLEKWSLFCSGFSVLASMVLITHWTSFFETKIANALL